MLIRPVLRACRWVQLAAAALFLVLPGFSIGQQSQSVLCSGGNGNFESKFRTGVQAHVGARNSSSVTLATRTCAAKLTWDNQELAVADGASEVDLDVFGVDLGDGIPVAAFQVKQSATDCCMDYRIYSLEKPPRLLRTLKGGGFFSASDTDLDGKVEIWSDDAAAVDGFEELVLSELDSAPIVVFRYAHGQLRDVTAEFQSYFDTDISRLRAGLNPHDLQEFKNSDGALATRPSGASTERLGQLRRVKIKVLEIVWAYLYSGREQEAWRSLADMWPAADAERIRAALLKARSRGIHGEAEITAVGPPPQRKKQAQVFNAVSRSGPGNKLEVVPPQAILLQRPPPAEAQTTSELLLDLIVDAAGKVRSAEPANKVNADPELVNAALGWKFIPAFKEGRAVASRLRIAVSSKQ